MMTTGADDGWWHLVTTVMKAAGPPVSLRMIILQINSTVSLDTWIIAFWLQLHVESAVYSPWNSLNSVSIRSDTPLFLPPPLHSLSLSLYQFQQDGWNLFTHFIPRVELPILRVSSRHSPESRPSPAGASEVWTDGIRCGSESETLQGFPFTRFIFGWVTLGFSVDSSPVDDVFELLPQLTLFFVARR